MDLKLKWKCYVMIRTTKMFLGLYSFNFLLYCFKYLFICICMYENDQYCLFSLIRFVRYQEWYMMVFKVMNSALKIQRKVQSPFSLFASHLSNVCLAHPPHCIPGKLLFQGPFSSLAQLEEEVTPPPLSAYWENFFDTWICKKSMD